MAETAKSMNYKYIAICDHSLGLRIAHGLTEEKLKKQLEEIEKLNRKMENFTILSSIELNIDVDGNLDMQNAVLKDLDVVIASIHSGFKQDEKKTTDRILNAIYNENVKIIGHPTGRIINKREPYLINLSKVYEAASKHSVFLEINAYLDRLDLSDLNCFKAKDFNLKFSIGTDAHNKDHMRSMELGIATARRGWLEKKNIINALNIKELEKLLKK